MPLPVDPQSWTCPQCQRVLMLKPHEIKLRKFCSRACQYASIRRDRPAKPRPVIDTRTCEHCGTAYEAHSKVQRYCSQTCQLAVAQRRRTNPKIAERACETCGTIFRPKQESAAGRFCSRVCLYAGTRRENSSQWRGGRHIKQGYVKLYRPEHPLADGLGYVLEHRFVMEEALGRALESTESVHHIDGDRANNEVGNLQLRNGKHGVGIKIACLDCGSQRIGPVPLD